MKVSVVLARFISSWQITLALQAGSQNVRGGGGVGGWRGGWGGGVWVFTKTWVCLYKPGFAGFRKRGGGGPGNCQVLKGGVFVCNNRNTTNQGIWSYVRKMATSLLKQHCYCLMLLMRTAKTAVCLQTKAVFHHRYGF